MELNQQLVNVREGNLPTTGSPASHPDLSLATLKQNGIWLNDHTDSRSTMSHQNRSIKSIFGKNGSKY